MSVPVQNALWLWLAPGTGDGSHRFEARRVIAVAVEDRSAAVTRRTRAVPAATAGTRAVTRSLTQDRMVAAAPPMSTVPVVAPNESPVIVMTSLVAGVRGSMSTIHGRTS